MEKKLNINFFIKKYNIYSNDLKLTYEYLQMYLQNILQSQGNIGCFSIFGVAKETVPLNLTIVKLRNKTIHRDDTNGVN